MILKNRYILLIVPVILLLLLGAGCAKSDKDIVVDFLMDWAKQRDIVDANGTPTGKAVGRALFGVSTDDPQADAAIDAGVVVNSIRNADNQIIKADQELNRKPPKTNEAIKHLNSAVNARPNDWFVRNHRAVVLAEAGQNFSVDANRAIKICQDEMPTSKIICQERVYENRAHLLMSSISRQFYGRRSPKCSTYKLQAETYRKLHEIYKLNKKPLPLWIGHDFASAATAAQKKASQPGVTCEQ